MRLGRHDTGEKDKRKMEKACVPTANCRFEMKPQWIEI